MFGKGMSSNPLTIIPLTIRWFGARLLKHLASQSGDKSTALQTLREGRRRSNLAERLDCARLQRRSPRVQIVKVVLCLSGQSSSPFQAARICSVCFCGFAPWRLCVSIFIAKTPRRKGAERKSRTIKAGFEFWVWTCSKTRNRRLGRGMFGKGMSSIPLTIIPLTVRLFGGRLAGKWN